MFSTGRKLPGTSQKAPFISRSPKNSEKSLFCFIWGQGHNSNEAPLKQKEIFGMQEQLPSYACCFLIHWVNVLLKSVLCLLIYSTLQMRGSIFVCLFICLHVVKTASFYIEKLNFAKHSREWCPGQSVHLKGRMYWSWLKILLADSLCQVWRLI